MNICIFGGSATWGEDDNKYGGWVNLLRNSLATSNVYTYNLGVSGDTTTQIDARLKNECLFRKPSVIILSLGLNDSTILDPGQSSLVSMAQFKDNLNNLLKTAKQFTDQVIFIGPTSVLESKTTPIPWNTKKSYTNQSIKQFRKALSEFCHNNGTRFIDLFLTLASNDIAGDGLHPNTAGHQKIFEAVLPEVEKML